jgi:hypothetical protein
MALGSGPCLSINDLANQTIAAVAELQAGIDGVSADVSVGTVEVLLSGQAPYVTDSGVDPAVVLDFGLPSGGVNGAPGAAGVTPNILIANPVTLLAAGSTPTAVDINGDPTDVTIQFGIPPGADGSNGTVVSVGTPTTLAAGMNATVVDTGDASADPPTSVLVFGIPRGATGAGGSSLKPPVTVKIVNSNSGTLLDVFSTDDETARPVSIGSILPLESGPYDDQALAGQTWVAKFSMNENGYQLVHEVQSLHRLVAACDGAVDPEDLSFTADSLVLASGRLPTDSDGDPIAVLTVENTGKISAADNDLVVLYHNIDAGTDESDMWSVMPITRDPVVIVINTVILAASGVSASTVSPGVGVGVLMEQDGGATFTDPGGAAVQVYNLTKTPIDGSVSPIAVAASLQPNGSYIVCSDKDFTGGSGFSSTEKQIWVHDDGDEDFQLVDYCYDSTFAKSVEATATALTYTKVTPGDGDCDGVPVSIINLGPCSSAPAAAVSAGWAASGFGY